MAEPSATAQVQSSTTTEITTASSTKILPTFPLNPLVGAIGVEHNEELLAESLGNKPDIEANVSGLTGQDTGTRKMRGNKGNFSGEHLVFLRKHLPEYQACKKRSEKTRWLKAFIDKWFIHYPWHLSEEPAQFAILLGSDTFAAGAQASTTADAQGSNSITSPAEAGASPNLPHSLTEWEHLLSMQREQKEQVKKLGQDIGHFFIGNWFHHEAGKINNTKGGEPFRAINCQMVLALNNCPRSMPDYKFWMSHPSYKSCFEAAYQEATTRDGIPDSNLRMAYQCKVAQLAYDKEPMEVKEAVVLKNAENITPKSIDGLDSKTKTLCRKNLTAFIQPLLDAIQAHTGLWLSLLAGAPPDDPNRPDDDFTLISWVRLICCVGSGTIQGSKFHQWNVEAYSLQVVDQWLCFLDCTTEEIDYSLNCTAKTVENPVDNSDLIRMPDGHEEEELNKLEGKKTGKKAKKAVEADGEKGSSKKKSKGKGKGKPKKTNKGKDKVSDGDEILGDGQEILDGDEEEEKESKMEVDTDFPPCSLTPTLSANCKLLPKVTNYLATLPDQERQETMGQFCGRMSTYEFEWENNIMRNKWILAQIMGGKTGSEIVFGEGGTPTARMVPVPDPTLQDDCSPTPPILISPSAPPSLASVLPSNSPQTPPPPPASLVSDNSPPSLPPPPSVDPEPISEGDNADIEADVDMTGWRKRDFEGRIVVDVLNCLLWWSCMIGDREEQQSLWDAALKDVAWVVGELVNEKKLHHQSNMYWYLKYYWQCTWHALAILCFKARVMQTPEWANHFGVLFSKQGKVGRWKKLSRRTKGTVVPGWQEQIMREVVIGVICLHGETLRVTRVERFFGLEGLEPPSLTVSQVEDRQLEVQTELVFAWREVKDAEREPWREAQYHWRLWEVQLEQTARELNMLMVIMGRSPSALPTEPCPSHS
ncbi:hypothetical protein BT96DRAFT_948350 [Gymnopus androsaceus JB14]|uniref:Uncharacterized protein n=1 Tax=Gymnopus androsaceus JB14 TaxID=1447944 RepID=A0A6A4GQG0_9AGAR|nr:hypothetical protein BT96DRAFT_948350 [Gymnopus androsaceus JB14]